MSSPALKSGKLPGSYWPQIWKTWVIGLAIAAVVITAVVIYKKR